MTLTMLTTVCSSTSLHYCVQEHGWWWVLMRDNGECCMSCQQRPSPPLVLPWAWQWLLTLWHSRDTSCTGVSLPLCCTSDTPVWSRVSSIGALGTAVLGILGHTLLGLSWLPSTHRLFSGNRWSALSSPMSLGWCAVAALWCPAWSALSLLVCSAPCRLTWHALCWLAWSVQWWLAW